MEDSGKQSLSKNKVSYGVYTAISSIFASTIWNSFGNSILRLLQNHAFVSGIIIGGGFGIIVGSLAGSLIIDYIDARRYERQERMSEEQISKAKRYRRKKRAKSLASAAPLLLLLGLFGYLLFELTRYIGNILESTFGPAMAETFWIALPFIALIWTFLYPKYTSE